LSVSLLISVKTKDQNSERVYVLAILPYLNYLEKLSHNFFHMEIILIEQYKTVKKNGMLICITFFELVQMLNIY
jgi:hypothetical protein